MKYETFNIMVEGHKIGVSNNPKHTKNKGLYKKNLYECFLVGDKHYAFCVVSKLMIGNKDAEKTILKMLLAEIRSVSFT